MPSHNLLLHSLFVQFSRCIRQIALPFELLSAFRLLECSTKPSARISFNIQSMLIPIFAMLVLFLVVGQSGLEPPTSRLSVVRSSQLSYGPVPSSLDCLSSDLRPYDTIGCQLKFSLLPFFFKRKEVVEISGIEPLTPCLQSRCSPS